MMHNTLGYHRGMAVAVFGDESPAVAYLDGLIEEQGEDELVLADESQLILLLMAIHQGE